MRLINTGSQPNDKTGDSLRESFTKTNENFQELYDKILDEDDFASDSESSLATQQSIKAYVDAGLATAGKVESVNGEQGAVILDSGDVAEGSNLYYTEARVDSNSSVVANTAKVSADGSVVSHNDITDAGSGKIITDDERSTLASGLQPGDNISELTNDSLYQTKAEVDTTINDLIDSAPGTLDTLGEIAAALQDNDSEIGALVAADTAQKTRLDALETQTHDAVTLAPDTNTALELTGQELKLTLPELLDEDDMASDSETQGATQQSIKAYVDNKPSLRGVPVADLATLTALEAKDYEIRRVGLDSEYKFVLGKTPVGSDVADDAGTGAWELLPSLQTVESDLLIGQTFFSTTKRVKQGLCYAGNTYEWSDNPKLKALFDANGHGFIIDNGTTFTVVDHPDFIRPGTTEIGEYQQDTIRSHTHTYQSKPTNFGEVNNGSNYFRGDGGRNNTLITKNTGAFGGGETAPRHRKAYFGIYGDFVTITVRTDDITEVFEQELPRVSIQAESSFVISNTSTTGRSLKFSGASVNQPVNTERVLRQFTLENEDTYLVVQTAATYKVRAGWNIDPGANSGTLGGILHIRKSDFWSQAHRCLGRSSQISGVRSSVQVNLYAEIELGVGDVITVKAFNTTNSDAILTDYFIEVNPVVDTLKIVNSEIDLLDEDDFASDSDTQAPTQQSVKAYVDSQVPSAALEITNPNDTGFVKSNGDGTATAVEANLFNNNMSSLNSSFDISSNGGVYQNIGLAVTPPAGKYLLIATISGRSVDADSPEIKARLVQGTTALSSSHWVCGYDNTGNSALDKTVYGTATIIIPISTDGSNTYGVEASQESNTTLKEILPGSNIQYIQIG